MEDVHRDLGFLGHTNRECILLLLLRSLTPGVRGIDTAMRSGNFRQCDDLVRMCGTTGLKARDQTDGALLHGSGDELLHAFQLGGSGGASGIPQHDSTHLVRRHVRGDIHGDALFREPLEIAGKRRPVERRTAGLGLVGQAVARRHARTFAENLDRHALPHLALSEAVAEQRGVGMGMHVNETRRHDQARRIDHTRRRRARKTPNGCDSVAFDPDVA